MNICIIDPIETVGAALSRVAVFKEPFLRFPLMEDITINAETDLKSWNDRIPGISELVDIVSTAEQTISGGSTISTTGATIATKMGAKTWSPSSAKPWEIQVKIGFFSEVQSEKPANSVSGLISKVVTSAYNAGASAIGMGGMTDYQPGHWIHTLNKILSYAIISFNNKGEMIVPGCGVTDIAQLNLEVPAKTAKYTGGAGLRNIVGSISAPPRIATKSKLVHLMIPGIIDIPLAVITSANVTYSKHNTDLGYPLWATADVNFIGILPAMAEDLVAGAQLGNQMMQATNIIGTITQGLGTGL
jgi:hypothetical protein